MDSKIKILVNDDEDIYREGMLRILRDCPETGAVIVVPPGENPVSAVQRIQPHVFITSISGKIIDGISATKLISDRFPHVAVLATGMFEYDNHVVDIIQAGAKGCLFRDAAKEELLEAIQLLHSGDNYYCWRLNGKVAHLIATNYFANFKGRNPIHELTEKDRQFLKLLCQELSMKEICYIMKIDLRTLDWRRRRLCELLHKHSIVGLVNFCIVNGMFNPFDCPNKIVV